MRSLTIAGIVLVLLASCATVSLAQTPFTLTFEDLPDQYMFNYAGGTTQNLGDYFAPTYGVHFNPYVEVADESYGGGYNNYAYPPHSGTAVIGTGGNAYFDITLDTPAYSVSLWYTASTKCDGVTLSAFDTADNLLDSAWGASNLYNYDQLEVSDTSGGIARVRLADSGGFFTADDVSVNPTPEPCTLILLGCSGLLVGAIRRRRA